MARGPKPAPEFVRQAKAPVRSARTKPAQATGKEAITSGAVAPDWLTGEGLEIWNRLAPTLSSAKLLSTVDVNAFGRYCRNFARWLQMQTVLDGEGGMIYTVSTASGDVHRPRPEFLIADRLERQLVPAEDRFGLNPAERQRIMAARSANMGIAGDLFAQAERKPADKTVAMPTLDRSKADVVGFLN